MVQHKLKSKSKLLPVGVKKNKSALHSAVNKRNNKTAGGPRKGQFSKIAVNNPKKVADANLNKLVTKALHHQIEDDVLAQATSSSSSMHVKSKDK